MCLHGSKWKYKYRKNKPIQTTKTQRNLRKRASEAYERALNSL